MSDDTDFVALYDELGLDSECSMASFKHAYRRRIAKLHPDHLGAPSDISRLQRLNRLYSSALEFHRLHGRLPGASRPVGAATMRQTSHGEDGNALHTRDKHGTESVASTSSATIPTDTATAPPMAGFPRRRRYLLMLGLLALLLYWLGAQRTSVPTLDPEGPGDAVQPGLRAPDAGKRIAIGMEREQVRRILGTPLTEHEQRWEYGPSWIEFRCGKVTSWYASPLYPLRVENDSAAAQAEAALKEPPSC
ncbi:hypothetical protein [Pseudoxanthomonas sp. UTMC 1351]|uniref:outer membrane protein assembly factor BamE domain-containing protein n=1 Tax=Pseudoxanthomonas sp. UTMC 1351 TaxID=2695853 RepID=UPI0034CFD125